VSVNELKRMKELEAENAKPKRTSANLARENEAIWDITDAEIRRAVCETPRRRDFQSEPCKRYSRTAVTSTQATCRSELPRSQSLYQRQRPEQEITPPIAQAITQ
jgi:hypothetical protein